MGDSCECRECKVRRAAQEADLEAGKGLIGGGGAPLVYDIELAALDPYYEYYLDMSAPAYPASESKGA